MNGTTPVPGPTQISGVFTWSAGKSNIESLINTLAVILSAW